MNTQEALNVLNGLRQIRLAAETTGSEGLPPRRELAAAYWALLQATFHIDTWPAPLQRQFDEVRSLFFRYGLPPESAMQMTEDEAWIAARSIRSFARHAERLATASPEAAEMLVAPQPVDVAGAGDVPGVDSPQPDAAFACV